MELIGLCLAPWDEAGRVRARELAAGVRDWEKVLRLAVVRHVAPLLWVRLREAGAEGLVSARAADIFRDIHMRTAAANALRLKRMLPVSEALRAAGVGLLYFKGASLLFRGAYPDFGCRVMSDVDVLGREEDRPEIEAAFRGAGWAHSCDHVMQEWSVSEWVHGSDDLVEVHWSLKPDNGARPGAAEARLWKSAAEVEYRGVRVLVPSWEDCLIQAALHGTAHHYFEAVYLFPGVADLCQISARAGELDWDRMLAGLSDERMLEHAATAFGLAAELTRSAAAAKLDTQINQRRPELAPAARPLASALAALLSKPWVFSSFHERRLLAPKSAREWLRFVYFALRRRLKPRPGPDLDEQPREGEHLAGARRNWLDPDLWRYLLNLRRFDRKIGFKFYTGPEQSRVLPPGRTGKES